MTMSRVLIKGGRAHRLISGKPRMHSNPSAAGLSQMYYSTLISLILPRTLQFKSFILSKSDQLPRCN